MLKAEFQETVDDLKGKFEKVTQIEEFLQHNSSIKQLARSLLSIGDFLNYVRIRPVPFRGCEPASSFQGSYAGDAFGFRLDILGQLHDIRSSENRTLLGVLVDNSSENFKFVAELKPMLADDIQ